MLSDPLMDEDDSVSELPYDFNFVYRPYEVLHWTTNFVPSSKNKLSALRLAGVECKFCTGTGADSGGEFSCIYCGGDGVCD